MLTLLLIRHLPTAYNSHGMFMGREDADIVDEVDYNRVIKLRNTLDSVRISRVFSSPLLRCIKTANIVFPNSIIDIDTRLIERDFGEWTGQSRKTIYTLYPEYFNDSGQLDFSLCPPDGEDFNSYCQRICEFINEQYNSYINETIVVFTHGGVIATTLALISGHLIHAAYFVDVKSIEHLKIYSVQIYSPIRLC